VLHHLSRTLTRGVLAAAAITAVLSATPASTAATAHTQAEPRATHMEASPVTFSDRLYGGSTTTGPASETTVAAAGPQVVGGTPAAAVSYVGDMQLTINGDPNFHWCGVSLVSPWYVQTNAHCVSNEPTSATEKTAAIHEFSAWLAEHPASAVFGIDFGDPRRGICGSAPPTGSPAASNARSPASWSIPDGPGAYPTARAASTTSR
jgi:hypothetical protein